MISKSQLKYVRQLELKKYRRREGVFVAEGPKVVGDLLQAGFRVTQLFATTDWMAAHPDKTAQAMSEEELCKLSFLQHPQQVLGVFKMPAARTNILSAPGPWLALDGVQDPGNLGTIIRIADWFGIDSIFCSEDTADAWNPKVVQATMGSIARVNIVYTDLAELIKKSGKVVYGTLLDGTNIYEEELSADGIFVMGNEGNGISLPIRQLVTHRLLIPRYHEGPESLNVAIATAITCAELRRRDQSMR